MLFSIVHDSIHLNIIPRIPINDELKARDLHFQYAS